ncbi:unnamed protein product [Calicophoron daubneyi]|uniref:Uncharacterized protein n=1 Tax=Calicophoron daubneyi TaxID=300641 RepID=A0AAV2TDF4_CALDB
MILIVYLMLCTAFVVAQDDDDDDSKKAEESKPDSKQEIEKAIEFWNKKTPLKTKPNPVDPMAGNNYIRADGDFLVYLEKKGPEKRYSCYTCPECFIEDKGAVTIQHGCQECVMILNHPHPPKRICNKEANTICRSDYRARCCRSELCNMSNSAQVGKFALFSSLFFFLKTNVFSDYDPI